jgi:hypothetical protein
MASSAWRFALPLLVAAVSCGRSNSRTAKLNDDLQRDLTAAAASGLELASGAQGYKPMRFVSPIEQGESAVPVQRRPTRRPVVAQHTGVDQEQQKAPDPAPQDVVEAPKAPEPQQTAPASDVPSVPTVAPRPAPLPVEYPAEGSSRGATGAGSGPGTDIGTIIGVVIRGGGVGDDHCVPPRGRPRGGIPLFPRIPRGHR